ncbi:MAG: hypothetical protein AAFR82_07030 [Pseudomonadota bacterium]
MSDAFASQSTLDPDRPWITDDEQMPARMSWFDTFLNPAGKSPKLHFTRAWTILFFTGLITWAGFGFIIFMVGIAGADMTEIRAGHAYMIAIVMAVTSVLSFVIHTRRLNHAGKISLRAIIVLVPLILATLMFVGGVSGKAAAYDELYEQRAEYLADPAAWREARLDERRKAQEEVEEARALAEANGEAESDENAGQRGQGGQRGGGQGGDWNQGPSPENPLPEREAFIVRPNLGAFSMTIAGLNTLIMIWSLLWVARVPNFGREPEPSSFA